MAADRPTRRGTHKTTPPPLSARDIRFAQLVADGVKGYPAYLEAGYPPKDTRDATDKAVSRLVRKREIRIYIRRLQAEAADAAGVTVNRIAQGLERTAFADRTAVFGPDGEMLPPSQWPESIRAIIAGVECEELTEMQPDPDTGRMRKIAIGLKWKVRFERSTEAKKILAQWRRMIGDDKDAGTAKHEPLVIGGEADVDSL